MQVSVFRKSAAYNQVTKNRPRRKNTKVVSQLRLKEKLHTKIRRKQKVLRKNDKCYKCVYLQQQC